MNANFGEAVLTVKVKFKIAVSLFDAIKMRFMGAKNADRIVKYIVKQLESPGEASRNEE